jgi:putative DNA primase/helicase
VSRKERDLTRLSDDELLDLERQYLAEEDRYRKAGLRMESTAGINAMIEQLKDLPGIRCSIHDFDAHPLWLNTWTCTLNLGTGETWPHNPDDLFTKVTNAGFDLAAPCPAFMAFLEEVVPDPETRAFLARAIGYCLSDLTAEQCMFFLYGLGRNGKTTFLNIIRKMLGDYATTTAASTLMVKRHGDERRNDIAVLKGARMVTATEAEDGQHMAEALIKEVTGGDPVTCRLLYAELFTFSPTFKIWLAANHKPVIKGQDLGIWRRIHLIPFEQTIAADKVDKDLPAKLEQELDGILAWAYRGWLDYREIGLAPPREVVAGTAAYKLEMDPLADFLTEACWSGSAGAGMSCLNGALYSAYRDWARDNGVMHPMTHKKFSQQMKERDYKQKTAGDGSRWWQGIKNKAEPRVF